MNNNPLKLQEFMNMLLENASELISYSDLLEEYDLKDEEMEEIEEWFAKFNIQI